MSLFFCFISDNFKILGQIVNSMLLSICTHGYLVLYYLANVSALIPPKIPDFGLRLCFILEFPSYSLGVNT